MDDPVAIVGSIGEIERAVLDAARRHPDRVAIEDDGGAHPYAELDAASVAIADRLLGPAEAGDLAGARVALLTAPGLAWAAACVGIWRAGGVVVPLCAAHPAPELDHVIGDSSASIVIAGPERIDDLAPLAAARGARLMPVAEVGGGDGQPTGRSSDADPPSHDPSRGSGESPGPDESSEPDRPTRDPARPARDPDRPAMILYTSGTTGRPKGVVLTRSNLAAQVASLVEAWRWSAGDLLVHVLPLHHTHGIVNGLLCALASGARCHVLARFEAGAVWEALAGRPATLFFGVPTMYRRLVDAWDAADAADRERWSRAAGALRLAVSGSAALPVPLFERWKELAGQPLLERYGMTEIGMALSNPLDGERRAGTVGRPLPGVTARRVDADGRPVAEEGVAGEIEIRGPGVFAEYLDRPEETRRAFRDGWFRTGDEATVEDGYWRILGRRSVDILKTGGEKVSALEVESALEGHPSIVECAVVGVPDPEWGERVCAAVVAAPGARVELEELRAWGRERMAPWKVPTRLAVVVDLPRNAMGKVTKPAVREMFLSTEEES